MQWIWYTIQSRTIRKKLEQNRVTVVALQSSIFYKRVSDVSDISLM